ncbi:hypothetical protein J32TS2_28500 [Shouchella clausii]|uniref:YopX family protein n=1 Tax=Shouchella clausii TaxID=79880 RepID=UPI001B18B7D1|nr:YopX family protein [Shouchella clausii]GIN17494.1 hypothetical protein J32TS2_28500 [Shouchella clausii]
MREIKFRAWSNKYKHMFRVKELSQDRDGYTHGLIDEGFEDEYEPDYDHPFAFIGRVDFIKSPDGSTSGLCQDSGDEPFILMQYTGLKDKNGTEIYEGDLLRHPARDSWEQKNFVAFEVFFHDNDRADRHIGFQMNRLHFQGSIGGYSMVENFLPRYTEKMEIIGNIYENPELLNN